MIYILSSIFILLVLSAFFSGSETALTAASRPLMHQLEQTGNKRAALVNRLRKHNDKLIGAILLGNNLVNILASSLATSLLITFYGEAGVAYATIAMTLLILMFAEVMPKTYAIRNADRMALIIAPLVSFFVHVLSPVTATVSLLVRGIFAVFSIRLRRSDGLMPMAEELRGAIDLHKGESGAISDERAMLRSVLDLAEVQVGEIMIHRKNLVTIDADQPAEAILDQVLDSPYTRIPLWQGEPDNIVGVLHAKALFREMQGRGQYQGRGQDLDGLDFIALAAKPWFVPETTALLEQLHAFRRRHEHISLVVDEYGSLMGIVTLEDILEEIVGDISDEHDIEVSGVHRQSDGTYLIQGDVTIRDLNRQFEWRLPDEEAATVAGLVLHESRRIPDVGQTFMFHGFRFEIMQRKRHQIISIRITPPQNTEGSADS